jgi:hypothetical protein
MTVHLGRTLHNGIADLAISLIGVNHVLDDKGHAHFMRTREEMLEKPLAEVFKEEDLKWDNEIRNLWRSAAELLDLNGPLEQVGPFVMGRELSNTDFVIASLVLWLRRGEGDEGHRWRQLSEWDGGRWGLVWKAIEEMETKSTEI